MHLLWVTCFTSTYIRKCLKPERLDIWLVASSSDPLSSISQIMTRDNIFFVNGLPVGFLLLWYSVLFTVVSISLLYLLFIS